MGMFLKCVNDVMFNNPAINKRLAYLYLNFQEARNLKYLNLSHNEFRETGGELIGEALNWNDGLEELDLSWNHLRRRGSIGIAEGLQVSVTVGIAEGLQESITVGIAEGLQVSITVGIAEGLQVSITVGTDEGLQVSITLVIDEGLQVTTGIAEGFTSKHYSRNS